MSGKILIKRGLLIGISEEYDQSAKVIGELADGRTSITLTFALGGLVEIDRSELLGRRLDVKIIHTV